MQKKGGKRLSVPYKLISKDSSSFANNFNGNNFETSQQTTMANFLGVDELELDSNEPIEMNETSRVSSQNDELNDVVINEQSTMNGCISLTQGIEMITKLKILSIHKCPTILNKLFEIENAFIDCLVKDVQQKKSTK